MVAATFKRGSGEIGDVNGTTIKINGSNRQYLKRRDERTNNSRRNKWKRQI